MIFLSVKFSNTCIFFLTGWKLISPTQICETISTPNVLHVNHISLETYKETWSNNKREIKRRPPPWNFE